MKNISITRWIGIEGMLIFALPSILYAQQNKKTTKQSSSQTKPVPLERSPRISSGKAPPTEAEKRKWAEETKRYKNALSYVKKDPRKALELFQKLRADHIHSRIYSEESLRQIALLQESFGDKKAAYNSWKELMFKDRFYMENSGNIFMIARFALTALDVGQIQEAQNASLKAISHTGINGNPTIAVDNVRIDKDNIRATAYLVMGVYQLLNSGINPVNPHDPYDDVKSHEVAQGYLEKAITHGRGQVRSQSHYHIANIIRRAHPLEAKKHLELAIQEGKGKIKEDAKTALSNL
jgi:tetratricopeptide (TPR) repeat protein